MSFHPDGTSLRLIALFSLVGITLGLSMRPAAAQTLSCLSNTEMREVITAKQVVAPAEAMRAARSHAPGDAVRMRLCRTEDGPLAYQVTIVKRDGKVRRVTIDAISGKVAAER